MKRPIDKIVGGEPFDQITVYRLRHAGTTLVETSAEAILESVKYLFENPEECIDEEYVVSVGIMELREFNTLEEFQGF